MKSFEKKYHAISSHINCQVFFVLLGERDQFLDLSRNFRLCKRREQGGMFSDFERGIDLRSIFWLRVGKRKPVNISFSIIESVRNREQEKEKGKLWFQPATILCLEFNLRLSTGKTNMCWWFRKLVFYFWVDRATDIVTSLSSVWISSSRFLKKFRLGFLWRPLWSAYL